MYYLYLCTPRVDLDLSFEVSKCEEREGKKARARGQLGQGTVVSCLSASGAHRQSSWGLPSPGAEPYGCCWPLLARSPEGQNAGGMSSGLSRLHEDLGAYLPSAPPTAI